jgi:transcriptional regulator with XRE-family HTH domain
MSTRAVRCPQRRAAAELSVAKRVMLTRMFDDFFDVEPQDGSERVATYAATVGSELRAAREAAGLSLRTLAEQVGVSRGYLSRAENGHVVPSWPVLERIATAYGCEPRLRLIPSRESIEAQARAMATMTPLQRLGVQGHGPTNVLGLLSDCAIKFVVTGAVAGVVQGLPMRLAELSVAVLDTDENLEAVGLALQRSSLVFREADPDELREWCAERSWTINWCDVRINPVDELPPATDVALGSLVIQVVPLTLLVAQDHDAADVFDRVRSVLAG